MDCDEIETEATKNMKEKTADEMFEELGYKKFEGLRQIEYHNKNYVIVFEKDTKVFYCSKDEYEDYITMQELKAINQKVKELRLV